MMLFFHQLGGELAKLFARKRTYIGFAAFMALEILILLIFQIPKVQRGWQRTIERAGYGFDSYFSGTTLAFQMVIWTAFILGGLYIALVSGDIVAKEVEEGTMRMTLCRPVSRVRLLLLKYCTCVIYTMSLVLFIGTSALAVATLKEGVGGFFAIQPLAGVFQMYDTGEGVLRYLFAMPFLGLSMLSVASLGFMLSCCNMKPAAATICTLSYFLADMIFRGIPYFEDIKAWFITTHTEAWYHMLRTPIPVEKMVQDYAYLAGINATLVIVGVVIFQSRDFKS
ncbi:MAG TPA: ABC transporter permease [Chthoniobacteraceae bacterium]|nr:ABC transporter permease [Chthoniobacteraceae bacterium]